MFNGDPLYDFGGVRTPAGGFSFVDAHHDRFFRDFGGQVRLEEWINNRLYEVNLGRFSTFFSPLTLKIERLRWGYHNLRDPWNRLWDQRNARFRAVKGDNETVALIAKTGFPGGEDDILSGDDIDLNRYLVAFRNKTKIGGTDIGFSFVNQHFTNLTSGGNSPGFFSNSGPLAGDIPDSPPIVITLKIEDDLKTDDLGNFDGDGAAIYGVKVLLNGVENPELAVVRGLPSGPRVELFGNFFTASDHIETNGGSDFAIYSFYLPGGTSSTEIKRITFLIDVARDYKISINRNSGTERTIFRAEGVPRTFSNREVLTYEYGDHTGSTILGVDLHGSIPVLDIAYNAEYAVSKRFRKFPTQDGYRDTDDAKAYFIEIGREFPDLLLTAKFFDYDQYYEGGMSVEDNDDRDDVPDMIEDFVAVGQDADRNQNGQSDFNENFLRFTADPIFRENTIDFNNNGIYDAEENDAQPDFPMKYVRLGQRGRHFAVAYRPIGNFKIEADYIHSEQPEDERRNLTYRNRNTFTFPLPLGSFRLQHEFKRVKDNIPDNTIGNNSDFQRQRSESNIDPLNFRDAIFNDTQATVEYNVLPDLLTVTRYNFSDRNQLFNNETFRTNFGVFRMKYANFFPFHKVKGLSKWKITPNYKFERMNQIKLDKDSFRSTVEDTLSNSFDVELSNQLSEKTSVVVGYEWGFRNNLLRPSLDNVNTAFVGQMMHQGRYWDKPLFLLAIYKREKTSFSSSSVSGNREEEFIALKAFFVW